jgi:hypothetical protein
MNEARRKLLIRWGFLAGAAALGTRIVARQNPGSTIPDVGQIPGQPSPTPEETKMEKRATKAMLEENQKNIKSDTEKLYKLASELKAQVEKTDSTTILSLDLVKKAEEIEKLAKQIKERAKG